MNRLLFLLARSFVHSIADFLMSACLLFEASIMSIVKLDSFPPFNQSNAFERKKPTTPIPEGPMSREIPAGPQSLANMSFGSPAPVAPRPVLAPSAPIQAAGAAPVVPVAPTAPAPPAPTPEQLAARAKLQAEQDAMGTMTPERQAQLDAMKRKRRKKR